MICSAFFVNIMGGHHFSGKCFSMFKFLRGTLTGVLDRKLTETDMKCARERKEKHGTWPSHNKWLAVC